MREEYIDYREDLPVRIYLANIREYPIHWHNSTELIFILKGSLDIQIGIGTYHIVEGQIEIVNHNEVHSMKSSSDNLVLGLNISPSFFKKYYSGAEDMYFYADSSSLEIQQTEKYERLRKLISRIYYESLKKYEDYEGAIEKELVKLMYHLVNNFHYLFYEEESLREDELELERYHRIVSFIEKNYMNRISLKELAEREFLSSQYLSSKIKETFGYSFIDFLNLIRVEESTKLLLTTDKNISDIALETGFSHVRYYNKHFKKHYKILPRDYRKKYKLDHGEFESLKKLDYFESKKAYPYIRDYILDYDRFNYHNKFLIYDLDLRKEAMERTRREIILRLSLKDGPLVYKDSCLKELLRDIKLDGLVVEDIEISRPGFSNLNALESLVRNFLENGLKLYLDLSAEDYGEFLEYMRTYNGDLDLRLLERKDFNYRESQRGEEFDGLGILGSIVEAFYFKGPLDLQPLYDRREPEDGPGIFYGGDGLISDRGLKKASYYGYSLISHMGSELIYLEENMVLTREEDSFQILLFNSSPRRRKFSINIVGLDRDYRVLEYSLDRDSGCVYSSWQALASPDLLDWSLLELLRNNTRPRSSFYFGPRSNVFNILEELEPRALRVYYFYPIPESN